MLTDQEKQVAAMKKKKQFFDQAESYVNLFQPKFFMPFAGRYTLGGTLAELNDQRGIPELEEAFDYFTVSSNVDQKKYRCIILNPQNNFDITTEKVSESYKKSDLQEKTDYVKNVLSAKKFDFEDKPHSTLDQIVKLLPKCYERFEYRRKKINYSSDKVILLKISEDKILEISCNGSGYKIIPKEEKKDFKNFVLIELDDRLLNLILSGPKFAHWNNAEIGSHLRFYRQPDVFERAQYHCLCYFHS
jgi:UDP-MurNAc hydroxylase